MTGDELNSLQRSEEANVGEPPLAGFAFELARRCPPAELRSAGIYFIQSSQFIQYTYGLVIKSYLCKTS